MRLVPFTCTGVALLVAVSLTAFGYQRNGDLDKLAKLFECDFSNEKALSQWTFTDPKAWRIDSVSVNGTTNRFLSLFRQSEYNPPVRSPINIALIKDLVVSDFVIQLKVRSTTRDYPHRDICLFFGYQDPTHFYYAHIARSADPAAHSIFIVNGEPRKSIAAQRTDGFTWDQGWHTIRLERTTKDGRIALFVDRMDQPIMTAFDRTFTWGQVGVGSFDDTGEFDDIVVRGVRVERPTNQ